MLQTGRKLSAMQAVRPAQGAFMITPVRGSGKYEYTGVSKDGVWVLHELQLLCTDYWWQPAT